MKKRHRVLVAPLDWGLGHSSRCVPIIKSLLINNVEVIIGGSGNSFTLLKKEFPQLDKVTIEGYSITYPNSGNFTWYFLRQFPKMWSFIKKENQFLNKLIDEHNIDAVISDNRYGLYNENIPSILITHQVVPRTGIFISLTKFLIKRLIDRFDQCWIPDVNVSPKIAGEMSSAGHLSIPTNYIGLLSRLKPKTVEKSIDTIVILSGPEPHRSKFENIVISQLNKLSGNHVIVRGTEKQTNKLEINKHVKMYNMLTTNEMSDLINASKHIIIRSGYSSLMDIIAIGRSAIIVPTKNQSEQEYLARYHHSNGRFIYQSQDKVSIVNGINELQKLRPKHGQVSESQLNEIVSDFCESLY